MGIESRDGTERKRRRSLRKSKTRAIISGYRLNFRRKSECRERCPSVLSQKSLTRSFIRDRVWPVGRLPGRAEGNESVLPIRAAWEKRASPCSLASVYLLRFRGLRDPGTDSELSASWGTSLRIPTRVCARSCDFDGGSVLRSCVVGRGSSLDADQSDFPRRRSR